MTKLRKYLRRKNPILLLILSPACNATSSELAAYSIIHILLLLYNYTLHVIYHMCSVVSTIICEHWMSGGLCIIPAGHYKYNVSAAGHL